MKCCRNHLQRQTEEGKVSLWIDCDVKEGQLFTQIYVNSCQNLTSLTTLYYSLLIFTHVTSRTSRACCELLVSAVLLIGNQCMYPAQRWRQKSTWHAHWDTSSLLCLYWYLDRLLYFWPSKYRLQAQGRSIRLHAHTTEGARICDISPSYFQGKGNKCYNSNNYNIAFQPMMS